MMMQFVYSLYEIVHQPCTLFIFSASFKNSSLGYFPEFLKVLRDADCFSVLFFHLRVLSIGFRKLTVIWLNHPWLIVLFKKENQQIMTPQCSNLTECFGCSNHTCRNHPITFSYLSNTQSLESQTSSFAPSDQSTDFH